MPNFTEYFSQYLVKYSLPAILQEMPNDLLGVTFVDRFTNRNYTKEIGCETEELFAMMIDIKAHECVNKYSWKIELFKNNYNSLLDTYITTVKSGSDSYTDTDNETQSNESNVYNYLNPLINSSETLESHSKQTDSQTKADSLTHKRTYTESDGKILTAKSKPEIMESMLKVNDIYEEALAYMDCLFMELL